jgi:hypothetical protein
MPIAFVQATHNQEAFSTAQGLKLAFATPVHVGNALITVLIGKKSPNPFQAGRTTTLDGSMDTNTPTPIVSDGTTALSLVLSAAAAPIAALTLTSADVASGGSTVYHGTITGGAANAFAGQSFTIAGFTIVANNGTFLCTASTATTLTLSNAAGAAETHAGTAQTIDSVYTGTITGGAANALAGRQFLIAGFVNGGNNGTFTAVQSSATTLVLANASAVNETHAGTAVSGGSSNWVTSIAFKSIDAKVTAGTAFTDQSKADMTAEYPAIYVYKKSAGVAAGEIVNAKCAYSGPAVAGSADANNAAGVSIFNGGVNAVALEFSGVTGAATERHQTSTANPAVAGATMGANGNLQIAVGYMKNANTFSLPAGWLLAYADKCVGTQDHFVVAYKIVSGADVGQFTNPLGYEMAVASLNLT